MRSPAVTVDLVAPLMKEARITRVADVTGLDCIGIPVVMVVRPDAWSLSVSQGKGVDSAAARASGIMESLELWYAEHVEAEVTASWARLGSAATVDVAAIPRPAWSRFGHDRVIPWVSGSDLVTGETRWIPLEAVSADYRVPPRAGMGCFAKTSNGLASGNCREEAIVHALCEVVERDALTILRARSFAPGDRRVDPHTTRNPACAALLARFEAAEVDVAVWDATSDVRIPCFLAAIADRSPNRFRRVPPARGAGCHPNREVALARALTEAAQCRLTVIAGTRDDHLPSGYERLRDTLTDDTVEHPDGSRPRKSRSLDGVASFDHDSIEGDLDFVVDRLETVGVREIGVVDIAGPDAPIAVVRVVVPGLEGMGDRSGYVRGARARAAAAAP